MNHGPYHYEEGDIFEKRFGDRSFTVILSNAYNAGGIIGSEYNGIVVLDNNNRSVLTDRHATNRYFWGTSAREEFESLRDMNWDDFAKFVRTSPGYRHCADDITNGTKPEAVDLLDLSINTGRIEGQVGPDIRTPQMINVSEEAGYSFQAKSREEMIVELANHKGYVPANTWNRGFVVSWDIKLHNTIDAKNAKGYDLDPNFDEKWDAYLEENGNEVFDDAVSDALRHYREGDYTAYGVDGVTATFYANGRSGGHLVLSDWSGPTPRGQASCQMAFSDRDEYIEWLKELDEGDLVKFYALVRTVDEDTNNRMTTMNEIYALIRQNKEEDWAAEQAPAI